MGVATGTTRHLPDIGDVRSGIRIVAEVTYLLNVSSRAGLVETHVTRVSRRRSIVST